MSLGEKTLFKKGCYFIECRVDVEKYRWAFKAAGVEFSSNLYIQGFWKKLLSNDIFQLKTPDHNMCVCMKLSN